MSRVVSALCLFASFASTQLLAQDPDPGPWLFGATRLSRPDPAVDEDASGFAHIHQLGERAALHVHVSRLDPGATYEVSAALGEATEVLGNITTRGESPAPSPRLFSAKLSGAQEVPPVETPARGFATLVLNRERTTLHYFVAAWRLSGPLTAAHIHTGPRGEDGPVLIPLDHETLRGMVDVTPEQVEALASGNTYVNLHTEANPDGEIRGQVQPIIFRHFWERRAGTGAFKLDTKRGDSLPFDATSIAALEGMTISILNAEKAAVLSGTFTEIQSLDRDDDDDDDIAQRGIGAGVLDPGLPAPDSGPTFVMDDEHDASFARGDANEDGAFDISDPVSILLHLFQGLPGPYCMDSADANDDGRVEISDPIAMLGNLFHAGDELPRPFASRGYDETADTLFCEE